MAVIDTFLKLMVAQKAERLVLVPDQVPTLFLQEKSIELSMPAVPPALATRLAREIVGDSHSDPVAGEAPLEGTYRTADAEEFTYLVSALGSSCRIELNAVAADGEEEATGKASADSPSPAEPPAPNGAARRDDPGLATAATPDRPSPPAQPDRLTLAFLEQAVLSEASDIFLSSGKPARMRLHGAIQTLDSAPTTSAQILQLLPHDDHRRELETTGSTDFAARWDLGGRSQRFRLNVFRHTEGLAAALRPIRARIPSLDELHLPDGLLELCAYPSGLVLVTGASGSGKSTTLAALIDHINRTRARHIITIEDPIEFEHRDCKSLVHQREVGTDLESFSGGLRAALRENPDVILLGEMRDLATISAALTAAETGHLVLSTLHTGHATAAVNRIIDVFPGHQQAHIRVQLAASLRAVVAQRLVPSTSRTGRLPAIEKLVVTPAVANSIRDGHEHHMRSAMQTGAAEGMITLERSLAVLECSGKISRENAFRFADDQQALQKLLD